jgi:ankyrin repeat protein
MRSNRNFPLLPNSKDVDITMSDEKGRNALHLSACKGHVEVVQALLRENAPLEAQDKNGLTALQLAAEHGHAEVVRVLLERYANVLTVDFDEKTALHHAVWHGHANVIEVLLKMCSHARELVIKRDRAGRTATHYAAWNGNTQVMKQLLDAEPRVATICDNNGRAAANGSLEIVTMLIHGELDAIDNYGRTPLNIAAHVGHTEVVLALLRAGADPKVPCNSSLTAMIYAAIDGHVHVIRALVAANVDINEEYLGGWTALHAATQSGHSEAVKLLLDLHADTRVGRKYGRAPLDIARMKGFEEIISLLQNYDNKALQRDGQRLERKPAIDLSGCIYHYGNFNTKQVWSQKCPPMCSLEIFFTIPYATPPDVAVGFNEICTSGPQNIRIKTYTSEIECDRFRMHIVTWAGSAMSSAGTTSFIVGGDDLDYQCGSFNTLEDHAWDEPQVQTTRRISFTRPYDSPPEVVVWLNCLDMFHKRDWRVRVNTTDITSTGFTLHIDSLGDTLLFGAGASWITYPVGKVGVVSGKFRTEKITKLANSIKKGVIVRRRGEIKYKGGTLETVPRVFVAFNMLSIARGYSMNVNVTTQSIKKFGMICCINAWARTRLHDAEVSYIAIC